MKREPSRRDRDIHGLFHWSIIRGEVARAPFKYSTFYLYKTIHDLSAAMHGLINFLHGVCRPSFHGLAIPACNPPWHLPESNDIHLSLVLIKHKHRQWCTLHPACCMRCVLYTIQYWARMLYCDTYIYRYSFLYTSIPACLWPKE